MQRCWDHNPRLRPRAEQVLQVLLTPSALSYRSNARAFSNFLSCREDPAWKRLTTRYLKPDERISLITEIFSDRTQITIVGHLSRDDAKIFIDMVDEVSFCALKNT